MSKKPCSEDLFALDDLSDLPQGLREQIKTCNPKSPRSQFEQRLIELFKLKSEGLNLDEVLVGYFRKYGERKSRIKMMSKLYNMSRSKSPAIETVKGRKGVYRLKQQVTT